ncbi:MAG TPA: hypothetical protein VIM40_08855, partial [Arthrobacter sp.]
QHAASCRVPDCVLREQLAEPCCAQTPSSFFGAEFQRLSASGSLWYPSWPPCWESYKLGSEVWPLIVGLALTVGLITSSLLGYNLTRARS